MAAGKIYKYVPKKRSTKSKNFKKAVTAIAKKAVMSEAETMTGVVTHSVNFGSNGTFTGGLFQPIAQGTAQNNRVGDEIRSLGIKVRGNINVDGTIITSGREYSGFRMMVVAGKRPLTSSDMPQFKGAVDPEAITVISDRYYKMNNTNLAVFINKYYKFKRVIKYAAGVPTRNELYLWIIPVPLGGGLTTSTGYVCNIDIQHYWKDI